MSKRTASTTTDSPSLPLNELSQSAQRQLAALRSALESRLAHLKEVLADPSRGESLAGLILDISRVATEEAQAAAAQACIATKVEAENEIAALRASAKAALDMAQAAQQSVDILDQERAANRELQRELQEAQQEAELAQLETDKQSELLAARAQLEVTLRADRDRFEAEAGKQKSAAADLQRGLADAQRQLETERRSNAEREAKLETERRSNAEREAKLETERAAAAELKRSAESAAARVKVLEREQAEARAAHKALEADLAHEKADLARERADLARERAAAAERARADEQLQSDLLAERAASAERERAYARLHSQLEAERASVAELKQAAARAEELGATLGRETSKGEEAREEIAFLHQSLDDTRQALTDTRQELDNARQEIDDARQAVAAAQAELERDRSTADRASVSELRQAIEYSDQQLASARSNEAQAVADHQKVVAQLEAMIKEREAVADELTAARKWINDLREAEAEFALPAAPKHVEPHAPKAKAKAAPTTSSPPPKLKTPPGAGEESWQAVRLANRYVFNTELMVQVNGDPARLFDLSISGCQLLSPTALKPNQMVKVLLPDKPPVTCPGKVVWTRLEPMGMGQPLGYRAGVRFNKTDDQAIETFAASHATPA